MTTKQKLELTREQLEKDRVWFGECKYKNKSEEIKKVLDKIHNA